MDPIHVFLGLVIPLFLSASSNTPRAMRCSTLSGRIKHSSWLLVKAGFYPPPSFQVVLSLPWFPHTNVLINTLLITQERWTHIPRMPSLCSTLPSITLPHKLFLSSFWTSSSVFQKCCLKVKKIRILLIIQHSFLNSEVQLTMAYIFWSIKEENYLRVIQDNFKS